MDTRQEQLKRFKEELAAKKRASSTNGHPNKSAGRSANAKREQQPKDEQPLIVCPPKRTVSVYFDAATGHMYARNAAGEYQHYNDTMLKLLLRKAGFDDHAKHTTGLTFLEEEMLRISQEDVVHYAGPLGGYPPGVHEMNGQQVLATRGRKPMKPVKGDWPLFRDYLQQLLGNEARYFCAWMKAALESLDAGAPWSPGQLLAIAGPGGSGKSVIQSLITPMLGGRVSSPYKYMTGGASFNAEIYGAEHGLIGDQNHRTDKNSRKAFGGAIKDLVVNPEQYVRGLWKGACTLSTFIRLSITLNDNPYALLVLPEMDGDVADKIMLLHASKVTFPYPSARFIDKHAYAAALRAELPAFLFHLRRWKIPDSIHDQRYGVVSYKSPELIERMSQLSSEWKLWNLIEMYLFRDREVFHWEGTAAELERMIRENAKGENLSPLFYYPGACGSYLTSLAPKMDGAIEIRHIGGNLNYYTINRTGPDLRPQSSSFRKRENP